MERQRVEQPEHHHNTVTDPRRALVLAKAEAWLGTPYHHMGRVKGAGTDCLMMLAEIYHSAGVIPPLDIPFYPPDWHLHRHAERYLEGLMQYAREAKDGPREGDVAVFKFGRCFSHGAIVVSWPRLIHAWWDAGVIFGTAEQPPLSGRPVRFFDPFSLLKL
jgi:cell wall-associated NlpC family hydrolase